MKMKALDTLHISAVSQHNIQPGETFEVSEPDAKDLEARGLAKPVVGMKAEPAPSNKAEPAPANKADPLDHDKNGRKGGAVKASK